MGGGGGEGGGDIQTGFPKEKKNFSGGAHSLKQNRDINVTEA